MDNVATIFFQSSRAVLPVFTEVKLINFNVNFTHINSKDKLSSCQTNFFQYMSSIHNYLGVAKDTVCLKTSAATLHIFTWKKFYENISRKNVAFKDQVGN
jgi:hypothetical protein